MNVQFFVAGFRKLGSLRVARNLFRSAAVGLPLLLAAAPLGDPANALRGGALPEPHAVDMVGNHMAGTGLSLAAAKAESRALLNLPLPLAPPVAPPPRLNRAPAVVNTTGSLGGFSLVGSVAVLPGDDLGVSPTVSRKDTGYGITGSNLAAVSTRFIQVFGDDYDQIAVFLAFADRFSPAALAYQQPVKNDVRGLGLGLFDRTGEFGSKSGRMQTVLNMKRINLYGRDAAGDPDNGLYPVWAQEAAHRWLVYYRYQREGETAPNKALLGRQEAHWAKGVQAEGSIMDGYDWKDNMDGTFTPGKRAFRYGRLDQYGMGLLPASEVPGFFLLENILDSNHNPVTTVGGTGRYTATRTDLSINDIIRALGPRDPAVDEAAKDLRMGVVLLTAPGDDVNQLVGEAFLIDTTRQLWTEFYNTAGGGRGKVCTELLHPCRGEAFSFDDVVLDEATAAAADGVLSPGEAFTLKVKVTNVGDEGAAATLSASAAGLHFDPPKVASDAMKPGEAVPVVLTGRVDPAASCDQPITVDVSSPGARGGSRALVDVLLGTTPKQVEGFEGGAAPSGWKVNPDGDDTGQAGRWAWGTPARSVAFGYTLQPGAAFSGERAFVTGLTGEEIDNVEGRTTLESPPFAVSGLREAVLSYQAYFVAADFAQEVLVPAAGTMHTLVSMDGGPFTEVDTLVGMATGWQRRVVKLSAKLGAAIKSATSVRLRFVAEEMAQAARPVVESAIDEVGIYDQSSSCGAAPPSGAEAPDGGTASGGPSSSGCACALGHRDDRAPGAPFAGLILAGAYALLWSPGGRRSRGRRSASRSAKERGSSS